MNGKVCFFNWLRQLNINQNNYSDLSYDLELTNMLYIHTIKRTNWPRLMNPLNMVENVVHLNKYDMIMTSLWQPNDYDKPLVNGIND